MTPAERSHYDNGIWLCAAHAPLIDYDWPRYTVNQLRTMKRDAETRAAANLEDAKIRASLQPVLDGGLEWHAPTSHESRPGYGGLHHVVFRLGGARKQRGRVYIDVDIGAGMPRRTQACMGEGTDYLDHEFSAMRPSQPFSVPVFTVTWTTSKFWLDKRFVPDHPVLDRTSDCDAAAWHLCDRPAILGPSAPRAPCARKIPARRSVDPWRHRARTHFHKRMERNRRWLNATRALAELTCTRWWPACALQPVTGSVRNILKPGLPCLRKRRGWLH